ncbi:ATP-binding protein [Candidatus Micrarchaeota archaeon]|nr:ATP-binding protein [Candidatus Micrarchaeota archaeon]
MLKEKLEEVIVAQRKELTLDEKTVLREDLVFVKPTTSFAVTILGIRRCGKSTLLKQLLKQEKNFYYLNLEDIRLEGFELSDFKKSNEIFKGKYGKRGVYFFDEIQTVPKWEKFVRSLVDKKEKIVLTGSNASLLSREFGTLLTGRHLNHELFPFSYKEFLKYYNLKPSVNSFVEYFSAGGFPEYLEKKQNYVLQELLRDVIMRDVAVRFGIRNSDLLKKLAIYLISNVGKEFSFNSLKKMFSVASVQTVIDYISFFEDSYLLFTTSKFSYSYKEQQTNPKKVYSIDNGLSAANSISFSKDRGRMLENQVFLYLRRKYREIFYFKEEGECDFVFKEKGKITGAIQVCYSLNEDNMKREVSGLLEALKKFGLKEGLILTFDQEDKLQEENKSIIIKPVWKWLLEK